jgi:hypothetical protein
MKPTDLLAEAEQVYQTYQQKRIINSAYQDAVISLLYLIARVLIAEKKVTKK